jgi:hypothetical protein
MDDRVISVRETIKVFPRGGGFEGVEMGVLGTVSEEGVTLESYTRPRSSRATSRRTRRASC